MLISYENVSDHLVMILVNGRHRISENLKDNAVKYLAVIHALSGCDTTSALFMKGKYKHSSF